jgi:hypothetical protein
MEQEGHEKWGEPGDVEKKMSRKRRLTKNLSRKHKTIRRKYHEYEEGEQNERRE